MVQQLKIIASCMALLVPAVCALAQSAVPDDVEHSDERPLPKCKVHEPGPIYPLMAAHLGQQGRVLVDFQLSGKGKPISLTVVAAEPGDTFVSAAMLYVKAHTCDAKAVDDDTHYRLSFVFALEPCPTPGCTVPEPYHSLNYPIRITRGLSGRHQTK
jgi:TonB family protein